MEPRFFKRGNTAGNGMLLMEANPLQWNHVFSNVEIIDGSSENKEDKELQWNHVFSNVEIGQAGIGAELARKCFNGTTFFQTWKFPVLSNIERAPLLLQWNHVFSNVEISSTLSSSAKSRSLQWNHVFSNVEMIRERTIRSFQLNASMEPRFFKRGNSVFDVFDYFLSACFNGTTFFQTWK